MPQEIIEQTTLSPSPTLTTEKVVLPEKPVKREPLAQPYLLNIIQNSKTNILDYSWNEDNLIYSSSEGIFEAGTNKALVERSISYIDFNQKGDAILRASGDWSVFNFRNKALAAVSITGDNPKINENGTLVASYSGKDLSLLDVESKETKSVDTGSDILAIRWPNESNHLAVYTRFGKFILYNEALETVKELLFKEEPEFLDISPDGNMIALAQINKVLILDVTNNKELIESVFGQESTITGNFIDANTFIAVETNSDNPIGRVTNNIWQIDMAGNKEFIADTKPILRKIDTDIKLKINKSQNVIPLAENNFKLWILGLIPGQLPTYTDKGVIFTKVQVQLEAE